MGSNSSKSSSAVEYIDNHHEYMVTWENLNQQIALTITEINGTSWDQDDVEILQVFVYEQISNSSYTIYLTDQQSIENMLGFVMENRNNIVDAGKLISRLQNELDDRKEVVFYNSSPESIHKLSAKIENNMFTLESLQKKSLLEYGFQTEQGVNFTENNSVMMMPINSVVNLQHRIIPFLGRYGYLIKDNQMIVEQVEQLLRSCSSASTSTVNYQWKLTPGFAHKTNQQKLEIIRSHSNFQHLLANKTNVNGVILSSEKDLDNYISQQGWENVINFEIINRPARIGQDPHCVDLDDYDVTTKIHKKCPKLVLDSPPQKAPDVQLAIDNFLIQMYRTLETLKHSSYMQVSI